MHIIQKLSTYLNEKFETLTFIGFIVAGVFYGFGFVLFNQYTTLLYGLFSGLILVVFLKNLRTVNIRSMWPEGFFTFAVVLEFGFLLYDQVHLKNDWYFLPWSALLGGVVVVAIGGLIMLKKIIIRNTVSKPLYLSAVFLLSTVYSYGFLSLTNIFNARQVSMGLNRNEAFNALRFSLGRFTTAEEIGQTVEAVSEIINQLHNNKSLHRHHCL